MKYRPRTSASKLYFNMKDITQKLIFNNFPLSQHAPNEGREEGQPQKVLVRASFLRFSYTSHLIFLILLCKVSLLSRTKYFLSNPATLGQE